MSARAFQRVQCLGTPISNASLPDSLAPAVRSGLPRTNTFIRSFSVSTCQCARNRQRGVSPLRRTGLKHPLSVSKEPLPKPVLDAAQRSKVKTDEKHGLWGFFGPERQALMKPEEDAAFGRPWTVEELRRKSWEDLHALWWICMKERNRIATNSRERTRLKAGLGDAEALDRDLVVRRTQKAIRHTLTERWYAWEHARKIAGDDPSIDLTGSGRVYDRAADENGYLETESEPQDTRQQRSFA